MTAAAAATPATYHILTLSYVENMLEKRTPYREAHLAGAKTEYEAGRCVMAGALQEPLDTGIFIFKNSDKAHIEKFVMNDAYFKAGLVPSYTIRPWMVAVGG